MKHRRTSEFVTKFGLIRRFHYVRSSTVRIRSLLTSSDAKKRRMDSHSAKNSAWLTFINGRIDRLRIIAAHSPEVATMPFVEQSFLEYCESLTAELNQLADSLDTCSKLDRHFLAALRNAADEICVVGERLIDKAIEVDGRSRRKQVH